MEEKHFKIKPGNDFMTLNVLLKISGLISTGGMAKAYLKAKSVKVNNALENRRGRKLYPGDKIEIDNNIFVIDN